MIFVLIFLAFIAKAGIDYDFLYPAYEEELAKQNPEQFENIKKLKHLIRETCSEYEIQFWFQLRSPFESEHMLPLAHVIKDNVFLTKDKADEKILKGLTLKKKGLQGLVVPNPPKDKFFKNNPRNFCFNTMWTNDDQKDHKNFAELTHGLDEDAYWEQADNKVLDSTRNPLLMHTRFNQHWRSKRYMTWDQVKQKAKEEGKYDENKPSLLYISTLNSPGKGPYPSLLCPYNASEERTDKIFAQMRNLTDEYNVFIRQHPYHGKEDTERRLPKAIAMPDMHPIEIAGQDEIKIVFGESSGATFAALKNFWGKAWVYPCPSGKIFDKIKNNIVNDRLAVIAHEDDDFVKKAEEAIDIMKDPQRKKIYTARRKTYYNKLMSGGNSLIADPEFADYFTIIHFMNSLKIDDEYVKMMDKIIQAYDRVAAIPFVDFKPGKIPYDYIKWRIAVVALIFIFMLLWIYLLGLHINLRNRNISAFICCNTYCCSHCKNCCPQGLPNKEHELLVEDPSEVQETTPQHRVHSVDQIVRVEEHLEGEPRRRTTSSQENKTELSPLSD
jgi:hypothetical protein